MRKIEALAPDLYTLGRQLGYPQCCIDFFALRSFGFEVLGVLVYIPDEWTLSGTGFVPCPVCHATKSEDELRAEIAANRTVAEPFPDYDPHPEMVLVALEE